MKKTIQTLVAGLMATGCLIAHGETQTAGGSSESSSGNPYEEMVQDFCSSAQQFSSALRTCGYHLLSEFNLHDCASALKGTSRRTKSASASDDFWSALIEGKKAVKTEIIKTFDYKNVGVGGAVIAATCGDVTIYFAVGEKGRKVEMDVFEKKEELEKILKEFEKVEKMDEKERRGLRQDAVKAVETARLLIVNVGLAVKSYNFKYGKYPDSLEALTKAPDEDSDPLLEGEPVDPWGNELRYEKRGKKPPAIISAGPDGEFDTDDDMYGF